MTQGFVKLGDGLSFVPVTNLEVSYTFQGRENNFEQPWDSYLYDKVKLLIDESKGLDDFGSFDEDPEEPCMQAWLVQELVGDDKHVDIIKAIVPDDYVDEINELLDNCISEGGGFRPTLFADSDDSELYSAAESIESEFNEMEFKVALFAASLAALKGYNLDAICYAWEQNGWKEEIEALRAFGLN